MEFSQQKKLHLQKIDLSKKGSIDDKINELVNLINEQECYVTTSSCSGRTIVFINSEKKKKGCKWLFVSHGIVSSQNIVEALDKHKGSAILKFEPFVMHVRCATIENAQKLHTCSLESGFRNSGFTLSRKGGIVLAIRSTLSLEVPLSYDDRVLVSLEYINHVVGMCNEKMNENWSRIERFTSYIKLSVKKNQENIASLKTSTQQKKNFPNITRKVKDQSENLYDTIDSFCDNFETMIACSDS